MSQRKYEALGRSIVQYGYRQPILVREKEPGRYEVLDGAHRFRALQAAGVTEIDCVVVGVDDPHAKLATVAMNNLRGDADAVLLAKLIADIRDQGLSWKEIEEFAGFSPEELGKLDALLDTGPPPAPDGVTETPIEVSILLWPGQKDVFDRAMEKAVAFMPKEDTIPLVGDQAGLYDAAMKKAMRLGNTKQRSRALELICAEFLSLPDASVED